MTRLLLLSTIVLVLAFAGCATPSQESTDPTEPTTPTEHACLDNSTTTTAGGCLSANDSAPPATSAMCVEGAEVCDDTAAEPAPTPTWAPPAIPGSG
ncbi:MAG TPA: hypothetical protein VM370_08320 [Candidatus Thermoplasmatota archaeon]|nr:hypothetical protein [Candidatus Thermoplasmatota archaeon]